MNEMLRELEEDIRSEKLERLWNSFGRLMILASIGVVVVTIAVVIWQDRKQSYATAQTSQFIKGLDRFNVEDYKGAIAVFSALAEDEHTPYFGMATLRKAQAQLLSGDKDAAMKTYETLAAHGGNDENRAFAELGKLLMKPDPKAVIEVKKDSPFYYTQSEWKGWQLLERGHKQEAVEIFIALRDDEHAPASMRERVGQVLQHVAPGSGMQGAKMSDETIKE